MKKVIDHIAFRVADLKKAEETYTKRFDFEVVQRMALMVKGSPVRSIVIRQPGQPFYIFVSQGMEENNIITKWVRNHGNALHHIAYKVDDIEREIMEWKAKKIEFLTGIIGERGGLLQIFSKPIEETGIIHEIIQRDDPKIFFNPENTTALMEATEGLK